jgi:hypothetical protein
MDTVSMDTVENPHAGQGMVVLDIGGDIGALVVSVVSVASAGPDLVGAEIEICPAGRRGESPDEGGDWWQGEWRGHSHSQSHSNGHGHDHVDGHRHEPSWPHVGVLGRPTGHGSTTYAAVFPGLRAGDYEIWRKPDGPTMAVVRVKGGSVTSVDWR